ncbi:MAG: DEAD/DEAH box helicase [Sneathiellales bacterium]|nr:DEAD/DEAH box helicase [Sneathiellales bacterium]
MKQSSTHHPAKRKTFADLPLSPELLLATEEMGFETLTPIQEKAIPTLLEGKDLIGIAQTGTGKTAAFSTPLIERLIKTRPDAYVPKTMRALILAPTRELARQIADAIRSLTAHVSFRTTLVHGGTSAKPQIKAINRGVDVVVATPGRLLELFESDDLWLGKVEYFVLDEADRMLDMGFIRDIRKIASQLPKKKQTLLFSATMPKPVEKLANGLLTDPVRVQIAKAATTADKVEQHILMVAKDRKRSLLDHLLKDDVYSKVLVFVRTKHGANRLRTFLDKRGISVAAIHGDKAQNTRQKALEGLRTGDVRVLVATDVAARGIDIDDISHVINYDLPEDPDNYVHRIGRTARAGARGISLSFCTPDQKPLLKTIEKITRQRISIQKDHPFQP